MKSLLITMMAMALFGSIQGVAQDYEYVPFVREGVKWVYYCNNPLTNVPNLPNGTYYFAFEMKGDVLIGEKCYKQVLLYQYNEQGEFELEDFIPVYLREDNKVVYALQPDGAWYPQCPVGIGGCVNETPFNVSHEGEFALYDFNDLETFYKGMDIELVNVSYEGNDVITIGSHQTRRHYFKNVWSDAHFVIEGIGYDGSWGMPLFYFQPAITGLQVRYYLSHVIEDGKTIYKGYAYNPALFEIRGDVNGDGHLTIADVTALIDKLLESNLNASGNSYSCDVNGDSNVSIADVTALIDLLLTNQN